MGSLVRGVKNAFRNVIRTSSIVVILGISVGLALVMLVSYKAVEDRIVSVKGSIGNLITVSPAGARGFEGGGEPLVAEDVKKLEGLSHVVKVTQALSSRMRSGTDTSLASAIEPGTLGRRNQSGDNTQVAPPDGGRPSFQMGGAQGEREFVMPIMVTGTTDPYNTQALSGEKPELKEGSVFKSGDDKDIALIGTDLAKKNNLKVGSTFTAYEKEIKVTGIFDAGNTFSNSAVVMPLKTVQRLTGETDQISTVLVQVDSITNLTKTKEAIEKQLGSKADVVTQQDMSSFAIQPLENIKSVSSYSLVGALFSGSVIIFLTMLMIVRERRREIGVLKAIGASNLKIVFQFVAEAFSLTALSSLLGIALGYLLSNPILSILVASNSGVSVAGGATRLAPGPGAMRGGGFVMRGGQNLVQNIQTVIGFDVLLYGLGAAVLIAVVGSTIPAWTISRIRPAEVMRSE
ncbi:MAG: ABC transporter permease [Candidatus Aquicultorales bacterium]